MKFQKLTIQNIASIENAVIDFDAQPLANSEVFLITGKTGAGKSTILDAICLALYADTPRLDGTKMQGDTKDGDKGVKINDPRQLLRRNTSEASVSLTFIGSNGVNYEAVWSVSRARKKLSGNIQPKEWQLKNLDTNVILTKDKEIEAEIKLAIGLDFSQFCRTTMLAQGEFTRFLNSNDNDKAEILEKITGVDVYSKIGAKIYAITSQKEQAWKTIQQQVEGTKTLTDEEIEEKRNQLSALNNQQKNVETESEKDAAKRDWLNHDTELNQAIETATNELQQAKKAIESEEFKAKETLINNWNATIDARGWLTEVQKAEATIKEQELFIEQNAEYFAQIRGGQRFAENAAFDLSKQIADIDSFLDTEKDKAPIYENAQTIVSKLTTISAGREAISKSNANIEKENKQLTETLEPAHNKALSEAKAAKESFETQAAKVKQQEEEVKKLNLSELRTQRDNANNLLRDISTAKERIEELNSAKEQKENTRKALENQKASIEEKKGKLADMDSEIHDAEIKKNTCKENLEKQKDTVDKFATALRLKLKVGDTCPVCQQKIETELPHENDLQVLVEGLQQAFTDAEKAYNDLVDVKNKLNAEINTESEAYNRAQNDFVKDQSVALAEEKALSACKKCGIELTENTLSALTDLENSTTKTKEELDSKIKKGEEKEADVKELRDELDSMHKNIDSLKEKESQAEKAVNDSKAKIKTDQRLIEEKQKDIDDAAQKLRELITCGNWKNDWNKSPQNFGEELSFAAKTYQDKSQKKQEMESKLNTIKETNLNIASVINSIVEAVPQWNNVTVTNIAKVDHLLNKANDLKDNVTKALTNLDLAKKSFSNNNQLLSNFTAKNQQLPISKLTELQAYKYEDIAQFDAEQKQHRDNVVSKETLLNNAQKNKNEHQQKKPELTANDAIESILERIEVNKKQLEEIGEQRGSINQELKTDAENKQKLGALINEANNKKTDYQKWSRMNQFIGDATGNKFRKIAQSYILSSLIHTANSYMKTLTDRYTLKVTPGTFVISIEDAYQGFVSRAASTISGGESFLVSLSLALALSDIGQTLSVDTLFIDEGFGTLSGEPLQKAVETLRSLHSKAGRHVGIISHVEELQERIPVQIQVNQEGNNSSSTIKIISTQC